MLAEIRIFVLLKHPDVFLAYHTMLIPGFGRMGDEGGIWDKNILVETDK